MFIPISLTVECDLVLISIFALVENQVFCFMCFVCVCVGFVVAAAVICKLCATHGADAGVGKRKDDVVEVLNESSLKCC